MFPFVNITREFTIKRWYFHDNIVKLPKLAQRLTFEVTLVETLDKLIF